MSEFNGRPDYVSEVDIARAAEKFVSSIGWRNAERLAMNLRNVVKGSDALKALDRALVLDFNVVRQEQIREEQDARR